MEILAMALILAAVLAGQYFLYVKYGLKKLTYTLKISVSEAFEGDEIEIIEEIDNEKALPLPWVRTEISCSGWLTFSGQRIVPDEKNEQRGLISGVFVLRGRQRCRRAWKVRCEKRGVHSIDSVAVSVSDLFGLAKPTAVIPVNECVRVLPLPAEMDEGELSGDDFIGDVQVRRFVLPDPFVISGAREYTGREPMNRIHWAQTARTGSLMVYNNEFTTERRILIVMNMQRNPMSTEQKLSVPVLESQIKAAAYAAEFCAAMRAEFTFIANTAGERLIIAPGEGYEQQIKLLRGLAEIRNGCGGHFDDLISELDFFGMTDVIFISGFVTERLYDVIERLTENGVCCKLFSPSLDEENCALPALCELRHIPRVSYNVSGAGDD